jgi:GDP-L-fucose synthase
MTLDLKKYQSKIDVMQSHLNVGFGSDITIHELAMTIKKVIGFEGLIQFDSKRPDGSPQKLIDSSRINDLGWQPKTDLESGLNKAYQDFLLHHA